MLRGIYCHKSPLSKLVLLVTLFLGFLLFSSLVAMVTLMPFYGIKVIQMLTSPDYSDPSVVNAMKFIQIINMVGGLLFPALLYLWLSLPNNEKYQGFRLSVSAWGIPLAILLMIAAQPLVSWTNELNSYLKLPQWLSGLETWMKNTDHEGELITDAFLNTTSYSGLMVNIFMIALLPAFAEELLFRGALARLMKEWTHNIHIAVFISAFVFSAIHLQFYGFLPRFLLGEALGYLFFWSGSLWLPIAAHFTNNFLSVIVDFLYHKGYTQVNSDKFGTDNAAWLTILSLVIVGGILYYIRKTSLQGKSLEKL